MKPSFAAALAAIASLALGAAQADTISVSGALTEARYFTTAPSTPAGAGDTGYNMRHRPKVGGELSGVARLVLGDGVLCSGALLGSGYHILTAAHCVTDEDGNLNVNSGVAQFALTPAGNDYAIGAFSNVAVNGVKVHPGWTGDYIFGGHDIAIVSLAQAAPTGARMYDIYTEGDEVGQTSRKSGWGNFGQGSVGVENCCGWRTGLNTWDLDAKAFWGSIGEDANPDILMYDFDNGTFANDAFGRYFGLWDTGLGDNEVMSGRGDSGGPSFIDGKIAGVTSFGLTFGNCGPATATRPPGVDLLCGLNNSFGEFGGDTRVSGYADWINANAVPAPGALALSLGALAGLGLLRRRRDA